MLGVVDDNENNDDRDGDGKHFRKELLRELADTHLDAREMTLSFYWRKLLQLLESERGAAHDQA